MREIDPLLGDVVLRPEVRLSDEEAYQIMVGVYSKFPAPPGYEWFP